MDVGLGLIIKRVVFACLVLGFAIGSTAQSNTDVIRIDYGKRYELQDSYSILYDNPAASAKLKAFRVVFYDPEGRILLETETETHPLTGNVETYQLGSPVIGFSEVGLSVLSLHDGTMIDFPTDIGAILGLSEMTEVSEPIEAVPDMTPIPPPPTPSVPTLIPADKARLAETASALSALLSTVNEKLDQADIDAEARQSTMDQLVQLKENISSLSKKAVDADATDLEIQINALALEISAEKYEGDATETLSLLGDTKSELLTLQTEMEALQNLSEREGADISNVMPSLAEIENRLDELDQDLTGIILPAPIGSDKIDAWNAAYVSFETQLNAPTSPAFNWPIFIIMGVALLALIAWLAKLSLGGKAKVRPSKSILHGTQPAGVIFPASPILAGNVAAPLSAAGQLTVAQLQMLTGPYSVLRDAYEATGRIGYAQDGIPTAEDYSFGTGFLISDRHVLTNRHVHGLYGHYLMDDTDPGGIEFIAEKDKDASDFMPFQNKPPLLLPALDIAIYTLAKSVKNRKPIPLAAIETDTLGGREVVVIGYPDTHTPELEEIKAVVEDDAVFAVKRISQGHIFRHSTDTDTPFGVETEVSEDKHRSFVMPAICHNASTLSGNSGSPLLDIETGELLGIHFAGFKAFNKKEAANLAMAIAQLTDEAPRRHLSAVTKITS